MALRSLALGRRRWRAWRRQWHDAVLSALRSPPPPAPDAPVVPVEADAPLLSAVYGWAVARKRQRELASPVRVAPRSVPVVSVGNFTFGATGKTPLALFLVAFALRHGGPCRVPMLLSRGYGDDEWRLLARKFPSCALALGADRVRVGSERVRDLERPFGASAADLLSCVVVDDGLQQWRLAKDLEVVMVDALHPFGNGKLLPCGSLREDPRDALARADIVILHHADLLKSSGERRALMDALGGSMDPSRAPVVATSRMKVVGLAPALKLLGSAEESERMSPVDEDMDDLKGSVALVWCGVGNPESVRLVVERLATINGESVWHGVEMEAFPDHHAFSSADVDDVLLRCQELRARHGDRRVVVVTTEKDLFRAREPMLRLARQQEMRVLQCELELQEYAAIVHERLRRLLASNKTCF